MACWNNDSGGEKKKEKIRNSNMKQKQININMNNIFSIIRLRYTIGYSRKNPNRGGEEVENILSEKYPWNYQICHFTLRNSGKNKPSPLEIPSSKTKGDGNSTYVFLEYPWKFHFFRGDTHMTSALRREDRV